LCAESRLLPGTAGRSGDRPLLTIISPRQAAAPSSANTSGNFGWGDDSDFEVYVYGPEGLQVEGFDAPVVEHEGARYVELRLPRDCMAAIVRR
jgi:hypothetical protein